MEVSLLQILEARENRVLRQKELLARFGKPLICFTMNIAGPVKRTDLICQGFRLGCGFLEAQLKGEGIPILFSQHEEAETGCQAFYVVDCAPARAKALCLQIEEEQPVGRLFDMDVLAPDGSKEARAIPRKCLLCDQPAQICGRSRAHTVEALQHRTNELLREAVIAQDARHIARIAQQSLLYEVCTTPKPGLVDCHNSGSHRDMDLFTFMSSSAALFPYFETCARIGLESTALPPQAVFSRLRMPGKLAEQAMEEATDGVNTHKGAIFSMGILCAAAGRLPQDLRTPEAVCAQCAAMLEGITTRDFAGITLENAVTNGQKLYVQYGITGIRGQAEAGFPAVLEAGLPTLEAGLARGLSLNDAGCAALLHLMVAVTDTNLIKRSDLQTRNTVTERIACLLQETPFPRQEELKRLDEDFIQKNLSPGGSADLLAITYFLHFLK